MREINTRRVMKELVVLRELVGLLEQLEPPKVDGEEKKRPTVTFYPNPNNPALTAFSAGRIPMDKICGVLTGLYDQLAKNEIGVMLDAIVLKPLVYRSAEDARNHSLKKTMFINLCLSAWCRDNIMRMVTTQCPEDKFYDVKALLPILDQLDADIEVVKFEQSCESEDSRPAPRKPYNGRKKEPRAPLITADAAMELMEKLGIGGAANALLPALGFKSAGSPKAEPETEKEMNDAEV